MVSIVQAYLVETKFRQRVA